MPSPFYNAIKGTTSGTPGTGAFTPNAAATGYRAWSNVPAGWIGLVRYEDGAAWELCFSYWNGTLLSRATTQLYDSSSGSALSLTSAATAAMVADASEVMSHLGTTQWRMYVPIATSNSYHLLGIATPGVQGTGANATIANTNLLTSQIGRIQYTSATTANAQAGISSGGIHALYSTVAGQGGFEFTSRFGASQLPTGPRLFVGMSTVNFAANTGEPSALAASIAAFTKDSTDTNIQLLTKDGTTANKTDTGIALAANGWYEECVWAEPGGGRVYGLLIRLDTGAIWFGSTATNLPANGAGLLAVQIGGLNGTNTGTAFIMHGGGYTIRSGG